MLSYDGQASLKTRKKKPTTRFAKQKFSFGVLLCLKNNALRGGVTYFDAITIVQATHYKSYYLRITHISQGTMWLMVKLFFF